MPDVTTNKCETCSHSHAAKKAAAPKKAAADSKKAAAAEKTEYYGRGVEYSDVHTSQLDTFYDLALEMKSKRLPQPSPKK